MRKLIDLTGQQFDRLTVIKWVGKQSKRSMWECRCECGRIKTVRGDSLKNRDTRSCGCLHKETVNDPEKSYTKACRIRASMLRRCRNLHDPQTDTRDVNGGDVAPEQ